ncbi:MAG: hypothetical protein R3348_03695 [Xanthomonadales bacterium]|nr:hypothetical protein [Xanthomonadales bacterium]
MNQLNVNVIATHRHTDNIDDNDMVLVVEVTDTDGIPVTGLDTPNFEVWQVGIVSFGRLNPTLTQHLGEVDEDLNGVYHVVRRWNMFAETQCGFCVIVKRTREHEDGRETTERGRGMAALVTQGQDG